MPFDVEGAKKAGYSPGEIADFLAAENNFDAAAARESGYKDEEILSFLTPAPTFAERSSQAVEDVVETGKRIFRDPAVSLLKGSIGAVEGVVGLADLVTDGSVGKAAEEAGLRFKEAKKLAGENFSETQKGVNKELEETKGFMPTVGTALSNPSTIVHSALESAPSMVMGGAAGRALTALGAAPVVAGAVGEGLISAGSSAEQIRQENKSGLLEDGQAPLAIGSGLVTTLFGVAGGKFSQKLGFQDIDTMLASKAVSSLEKKTVVKSILGSMASEGLIEEMPQSSQEQIALNLALGKPWNEGVPEAAAMGGLTGAFMGAGANAVSLMDGDNKAPLSSPIIPPAQPPSEPPKWDWPTSPLNADADVATQALIASIDADLITPEAVAEANAIIAEETLKEKNPPLPEAKQAWSVLNVNSNLDSGELGASAKETANSLTYDNPNKLPRADTTFMFGPGEAAGKTPNQVMPEAGTYVLGQESEDRSTEFLKAVSDDIEAWRQKYMPNATFVISNEALPFDNALGWHHYENGAHLIVPPAIRKPSKGFGAFSANKQAAAFYNLSHEFGHGLLKQVFMGETDPLTGAMLDQEARKGLVSEQTISQLSEGQQGIVREFNEKKQQILSGVMTAEQFQHEWAGPAKAGRKNFLERLSEQATALDLLRRIATDAVASAEKREAIDRKQEKFFFPEESRKRMIQGLVNDMMSFDEYFAEQTAKHAYKAKWEEGSATGNLFKQALNSLRQFFIDRKKDGIIAPGIAFSNWIEGLTKIEQVTNKTGVQENALKSKKTVAKAVEGKKKAKTKVERLQHNAETDTAERQQQKGRLLITGLFESGQLGIGSPDATTLNQLLKQKDFDEFVELYKKFSTKRIKFELTGESEDVGMITDLKVLIKIFGLNMYSGDTANIMAKELVQNSFDAIKSMLYNKRQSTGTIVLSIDKANRQITVSDDGIGMDKETLLKAFLTYPGTSKPDLPPEQSSGGLGQAKQVLLFTPERIEVETSKNGHGVRLDATPQQLLDKKAKMQVFETTPDKHGTVVRVTMPEKVERNGEMVNVDLEAWAPGYDIYNQPPIYPGIRFLFDARSDKTIPATEAKVDGYDLRQATNLLETHKLLVKEKHDWGYVDVYTGATHDNGWQAKHRVMSAGLWQFDTTIKSPLQDDKIPMDLIFDLHPSVPGQHSAYPFTPNRQGLKEAAVKQLNKAVEDVIKQYIKDELRKHVDAYTNVLELPIVRDDTLALLVSIKPPQFTIAEGKDSLPSITFVRGIDAPPSLFYNPTNKDFLSIPGAGLYFAKLAGVHRDFIKHANNYTTTAQLYAAGVGLDRGKGMGKNNNGWAGLHFKKPYHSMWLNPVYDGDNNTPEAVGAGLLETMMHEAMHITAPGHDAAAFWALHRMYSVLNQGNELAAFRDRITAIVTQHWVTHQLIGDMYNAEDTVNTGSTIKGDVSERVANDDSIEDTLETVRSQRKPDGSGSNTTGDFRNVSFELDLDEDSRSNRFIKGIKDFVTSPGPIRRALRRGQAMAYWSMQFQQLAHLHPEMSDAQDFRYFNTKYNGFKNFLQSTSDAFAKQWSDLSGENFDKVNKIVLDHLAGDKLWFDLVKTSKDINGQSTVWYKFQPNATTLDEFNKRGVDLTTPEGAELGELILNVQNDLLDKLNHLEIVLRGILAHRHSQNQRMLNAKVLILANKFKEIRQVPFFPQGRFGNLMVIIERQKQDGTGWEVVSREAFESKAAQEKAHALAAKTLKPDERVQAKELTDQQYVLMALPTDFMDLAASELDLSAEQVDTLMGILQPAKTEKSLRPYDKERMKIKGYSTDAMRSYANFTWHQANLISKLEYRVKFNLTISNIKSKLRTAQYAGPGAEKLAFDLQQMTTAMERARDYIMSPPNEAQTLRGIVAVTYLALNVKTALVNGVGLITTWSDMTERLGLIKGSALMARAVKQVFLTTKLTNLNERTESDSLPPETQKALDQALAEGVLAQSYAYYLAGVANAGNLFRIPSKQLISKTGKQLVDASMWSFRLMELGTRRISFLARFEHERFDKKQAFEDAYNSAVKAVNILQNEYSLGNRPAFLRGFKIPPGNPLGKYVEPIIPMATVFMSFPQHMAFHVFGGYQLGMRREMKFLGEAPRHKMGSYTAKLWVILLALAGYEGLPMAEDLLNWLDVAWRKWGGGKSLRQELREYIQSVEAFDLDPQLLAHGLGHDVGGFDLSRSIGMGRLMPGVGNLATPEQTVAGTVGTLALDMFGPAGGLVKFGLEATMGGKPLSESMTHFPGGIGNAYSAYYWSKYGVRSPEKAIISFDEETGKPRELTAVELWGKAAGFNPTVVSQNREIQSEQRELKIYWTARRAGLLDDVWTADWQKDLEGKADARRAVEDFNSSIPVEYKSLRITGKNIQDSLVARRKAQRLAQQQKAPQKKFNAPYQEIRESFE